MKDYKSLLKFKNILKTIKEQKKKLKSLKPKFKNRSQSLEVKEFIKIINESQEYNLTEEQESILSHPGGPALVIAGPGTGKTEILAIFVSRLLFVDQVKPEEIFVTTFTKKSANNLRDRIGRINQLVCSATERDDVGISNLRIGTIHSLCNNLLVEYKDPKYRNIKLMDEIEQKLFFREHMGIVKNPEGANDLAFWSFFKFGFSSSWNPEYGTLPNKWDMTIVLLHIFNHLILNQVDLKNLKSIPYWSRMVDLLWEYSEVLDDNLRCDFSNLLRKFLDFLNSEKGKTLISEIKWVFVDEYQDTNRLQEEIYFKLASGSKNLIVVGDDDQAIYRFRGGTVECMVNFSKTVEKKWKSKWKSKNKVSVFNLSNNFRSHPQIVEFCNNYINSFEVMNKEGARAKGKKHLKPIKRNKKHFPATIMLKEKNAQQLGHKLSKFIREFLETGKIKDPNQVCLLFPSTREKTQGNKRPFTSVGNIVKSLKEDGFKVYNPRNKSFLKHEEVRLFFGALLKIIDPEKLFFPVYEDESGTKPSFPYAEECFREFNNYPDSELSRYIRRLNKSKKKLKREKYLNINLRDFSYIFLALSPFKDFMLDVTKRKRLAKLTNIIDAFASTPIKINNDLDRGRIKMSENLTGQINEYWANSFYYLVFGYLHKSGLDDIEEKEVICPRGKIPIMTIHQAKGLEFPIVFIGGLNKGPNNSLEYKLEQKLDNLDGRHNSNIFTNSSKIENFDKKYQDLIRRFYVAYSRAEDIMGFLVHGCQMNHQENEKLKVAFGPNLDKSWLKDNIRG